MASRCAGNNMSACPAVPGFGRRLHRRRWSAHEKVSVSCRAVVSSLRICAVLRQMELRVTIAPPDLRLDMVLQALSRRHRWIAGYWARARGSSRGSPDVRRCTRPRVCRGGSYQDCVIFESRLEGGPSEGLSRQLVSRRCKERYFYRDEVFTHWRDFGRVLASPSRITTSNLVRSCHEASRPPCRPVAACRVRWKHQSMQAR